MSHAPGRSSATLPRPESTRPEDGPRRGRVGAVFAVLTLLATPAWAAAGTRGVDLMPILAGLVLILIGARLGGALFARFGQSPVLGELLAGIVIGNLGLLGYHGFEPLRDLDAVELLAQIGVLFLLFSVGIESDARKMLAVGASAFVVAALGVIAPMILGYFCSRAFFPDHHPLAHWFVGATLCATSVGITARVLADLKRAGSTEGRIILGAAVIDDVHYRELRARDPKSRGMLELLEPISTFLVPVFFVLMGMRVDLRVFGEPGVLGFAAVLTAAAVAGKQVCGLGVFEKHADRVAVGLGMIPRGEVGLIFAGIGAQLTIAGVRVVDAAAFSAVVVMVALTTLMTPPLLVWRMRKP